MKQKSERDERIELKRSNIRFDLDSIIRKTTTPNKLIGREIMNSWSCPKCTFENAATSAAANGPNARCSMCGSRRNELSSGAAAVAKRNIVTQTQLNESKLKCSLDKEVDLEKNDKRKAYQKYKNDSYSQEVENPLSIDAIDAFLGSPAWRSRTQQFIDKHCDLFDTDICGGTVDEIGYSVGQHEIWMHYRHFVEGILEEVLAPVGCCVEQFVKQCDERIDQCKNADVHSVERTFLSRTQQKLLSDLLTFYSFEEFHKMMETRAFEKTNGFIMNNSKDEKSHENFKNSLKIDNIEKNTTLNNSLANLSPTNRHNASTWECTVCGTIQNIVNETKFKYSTSNTPLNDSLERQCKTCKAISKVGNSPEETLKRTKRIRHAVDAMMYRRRRKAAADVALSWIPKQSIIEDVAHLFCMQCRWTDAENICAEYIGIISALGRQNPYTIRAVNMRNNVLCIFSEAHRNRSDTSSFQSLGTKFSMKKKPNSFDEMVVKNANENLHKILCDAFDIIHQMYTKQNIKGSDANAQNIPTTIDDDDIPDEFCCPITCECMGNPVTASDGFIYEESAILSWMNRCKKNNQVCSSPSTNLPLKSLELIPNLEIKKSIDEFFNEKKRKEEKTEDSTLNLHHLQYWKCTSCTVRNPTNQHQCSTCGKANPYFVKIGIESLSDIDKNVLDCSYIHSMLILYAIQNDPIRIEEISNKLETFTATIEKSKLEDFVESIRSSIVSVVNMYKKKKCWKLVKLLNRQLKNPFMREITISSWNTSK